MPGYESLPGSHDRFTLKVLGGFALSWEGRAVRVPRASQRLLAFLALQSGMVKRVTVAGTLWPEASERHASSDLRSALARLQGTARRALAASKLELGLAEGVAVDLRHGQALARRLLDPAVAPDRSELGPAAAAVLSAELLPGWYDDWVLLERERLRQLRMHALELVAERLAAAGRYCDALQAAYAAVRAEPLRESAHRTVIRVHLAEGNTTEAVRAHEQFRVLLADELGVQPSEQMARLVQGLRPWPAVPLPRAAQQCVAG
jgi:DNA-binding SARP family transcriptional activator